MDTVRKQGVECTFFIVLGSEKVIRIRNAGVSGSKETVRLISISREGVFLHIYL